MYKFIEKERITIQLQSFYREGTKVQSSLAEKERKITHLQNSVAEKAWISAQLQTSCPTAFCICHVSGPGLSATANCPMHVIVELSDASDQPCSLRQNVTAELQSADQLSVVPTTVSMWSSSQYEVSYTALLDSMAM